MSRYFLIVIQSFVLCLISYGHAIGFEVKGRAVSTSYCSGGKCETDSCADVVIYSIDLENEVVIRKAIYNTAKSLKGTKLGGLQIDNSVYQIVLNSDEMFPQSYGESRTKIVAQRLLKAFGKTGADGFETIVIGEDFIHTSRSTGNYFVIYYYKRVPIVE